MARFKFRAWHPNLGRMRPCYYVLPAGLSDVHCVVWRCPVGYGGHLFDPLDEDFEELLDDEPDCPLAEWYGDVVIMQATGLVDGGGREIVEGDVVEFDLPHTGMKMRGVVIYQQAIAGFCVTPANDRNARWLFILDIPERGAIVLGNVHENPGLLRPA
jgi:hypothetical protein